MVSSESNEIARATTALDGALEAAKHFEHAIYALAGHTFESCSHAIQHRVKTRHSLITKVHEKRKVRLPMITLTLQTSLASDF